MTLGPVCWERRHKSWCPHASTSGSLWKGAGFCGLCDSGFCYSWTESYMELSQLCLMLWLGLIIRVTQQIRKEGRRKYLSFFPPRTQMESWPCWMKSAWGLALLQMRPSWKSWTKSVLPTSTLRAGWASVPASSTTQPCPTAASGSSITLARYRGAPQAHAQCCSQGFCASWERVCCWNPREQPVLADNWAQTKASYILLTQKNEKQTSGLNEHYKVSLCHFIIFSS